MTAWKVPCMIFSWTAAVEAVCRRNNEALWSSSAFFFFSFFFFPFFSSFPFFSFFHFLSQIACEGNGGSSAMRRPMEEVDTLLRYGWEIGTLYHITQATGYREAMFNLVVSVVGETIRAWLAAISLSGCLSDTS